MSPAATVTVLSSSAALDLASFVDEDVAVGVAVPAEGLADDRVELAGSSRSLASRFDSEAASFVLSDPAAFCASISFIWAAFYRLAPSWPRVGRDL